MPVGLSDQPAPVDTGTRLATALLAYMALVTAVITLFPFEFTLPTRPRLLLSGGVVDVLANVALFAPLGFLSAVARPGPMTRPGRIFLMALAMSATIEAVQLFEATRYASLSDVLANGAGAWLGALAHRRLVHRIDVDARTVGRLSLELPVMGLVYLLVPLLWVDGLAGVGSTTHLWTLLALGLFGASLLAAVQRHHFGPNHILSRGKMAAAAAAWFLLGAFPGLAPRASILLFVMLAAVTVVVWTRSADRGGARSINRRFESKTLAEAAPFYAAYLVLLVAPVPGDGMTAWRGGPGFITAAGDWGTAPVLHVVELVAAFTLLGYMLAEFRGRRTTRFRTGVPYVVLWGGGAAAVCELMEGFRPDGGASLARLTLLVVAAVYGGWLYHLQRAHVRRILGRA